MANLIFQSWLKDIRVHVEDRNLSEKEAMQLIKDFTAEHACNKVEFYMGMVADDQQTFEGHHTTPQKCFFSPGKQQAN